MREKTSKTLRITVDWYCVWYMSTECRRHHFLLRKTKKRRRYYLHRAKSVIHMPSTWCYMRSLHVSGQIELCCLINCWHLSGVSSWRGKIICHTSAVSAQVSLFNTRGPGSQSCISPLSSKRLQFHFLLEAFPAHSTVRCNANATIPAFVLK